MPDSSYDAVPVWNGEPSEFEAFVTSCRWYIKSLKPSERSQAAPRVWSRLKGSAKAVVRHLDPDQYADDDGLMRLIDILRSSPLQRLPISDTFRRLDLWHQLKRGSNETIAEVLVREEDLFVQLQQSLVRARNDRNPGAFGVPADSRSSGPETIPMAMTSPGSTPTRSPMTGGRQHAAGDGGTRPVQTQATAPPPPPRVQDFFEDELRGYRVLKAARLSHQERQNVLTQTGSSTSFNAVRRALRSLYAEDEEQSGKGGRPKPRLWWQQGMEEDADDDDGSAWWDVYDSGTYDWDSEQAYWHSWDDGYNDWHSSTYEDEDWWHEQEPEGEIMIADDSQDPVEQQYKEAFAIAGEANKTLAEAREAVRKTRQARGYFSPESATGKGLSGSPTSRSSYGGSPKGKSTGGGKGGSGYGPCFICGMTGHSYKVCPDRFSKGGGKPGFGKGKSGGKKGKFKGKGKGKMHSKNFYEIGALFFPGEIYLAGLVNETCVVVDTGASENAVGVDSLGKLVHQGGFQYEVNLTDRPTFRFGNGEQSRATKQS